MKTRRVVQVLDLYDEPEMIATYRRIHSEAEMWPEIVAGIRECGILEMELYIERNHLVMICDVPEDLDWQAAMDKMAILPRQAEWEAYVGKYQVCPEGARSDEKWHKAEKMFHLYDFKK